MFLKSILKINFLVVSWINHVCYLLQCKNFQERCCLPDGELLIHGSRSNKRERDAGTGATLAISTEAATPAALRG